MKRIAILVPYFGKLPELFPIWLKSAAYNKNVNFILIIDDETLFPFPENVRVIYMKWSQLNALIQSKYNFKISLKELYKLCDYRVAYGEIFDDLFDGYDYWGFCDIDLVFGQIRNFITDEILDKYDKIQWRGHLTLFKNDAKVNARYRLSLNNIEIYKNIFMDDRNRFFDEEIIHQIYDKHCLKYYKVVNFADLKIRSYNFFLAHLDEKDSYKNKFQIFKWDNGKLMRLYLLNDKIIEEEFMYIHFLKRNMDVRKLTGDELELIIIPNQIAPITVKIDVDYIKFASRKKIYFRYFLPRLRPKFLFNKIKSKFGGI